MRTQRTAAYEHREEAGLVLAGQLMGIVHPPCVVVAIPRGGVLVASPIAERFDFPLTLSFARKLTLPHAPELAFGAVDEDGQMVIDRHQLRSLAGSEADIACARDRVTLEIRRQQHAFPVHPLESYLPDSAVLIVDDGVATGYTVRAAIAHARRHGARQVIVAVPCASTEAAAVIENEVDDFVCPWVDESFCAVGDYYMDFAQVTDDEVRAALDRAPLTPAR